MTISWYGAMVIKIQATPVRQVFKGESIKSEGRNPKTERNPRSEDRNPIAKINRDAALAPSPPSDGGEGWGEEARSFVCKRSFAIVSRIIVFVFFRPSGRAEV
jgi:hypothetical protein